MKKIGFLGWICQLIVILWALNSGVIAILQKDPLGKVLTLVHLGADVYRIVTIVVGAAALFLLVDLIFARKKKV
jgi:uncharacterized membrane protein YuzA (DUF378 family)